MGRCSRRRLAAVCLQQDAGPQFIVRSMLMLVSLPVSKEGMMQVD
jgi:hypothetical protein